MEPPGKRKRRRPRVLLEELKIARKFWEVAKSAALHRTKLKVMFETPCSTSSKED